MHLERAGRLRQRPAGAPQHADQSSATGSEHDGWLWKSLTGQKEAAPSGSEASPPPPAARAAHPARGRRAADSGSLQFVEVAQGAPAASGAEVIPAPSDTPAGPPPSIPPELPPPSGGVSVKDVKAKEPEKKKKGFEWSDLAPENVYKNMKNAAGYGPDEKIARAAMKEGEALFRDKKYKEAAAKFATAADRWPDSPLEEDALFLKAESEFFSDQYPKAHDTYGGLLKKYANTRHLDTVCAREFALGRYWEQLYDAHPTWPVTPNVTDNSKPLFDTFGYAIQAYERIRQHDPTGPLADASLMALGNAYFRHGHYEEAAYNYDLLRKEYPNSKHQMKAHLLGLQAKMRSLPGHGLRRDAAAGRRQDRRSDPQAVRRQAGRRTPAGRAGAAPNPRREGQPRASPAPSTTTSTPITAPPGCTTRA